MLAAVDTATSCAYLEMYIFAADGTGRAVRDRLAAAARRGVVVRVLVDAWGSWTTPDSFWVPLRAAGGEIRFFRPIRRGLLPFRDHRKLLVVDDRLAFLGGMNVADEYRVGRGGAPPWRDNLLEIRGPAAARLRRPFLRMWARADRPLRPRALLRRPVAPASPPVAPGRFLVWESGPAERTRRALAGYRQVLRESVRTIDLAMAYFYPPGRILREMRRAVRRGVRVRLLLPRHNDVALMRWAAHGLYGRLLRTGVEVWEYLPAPLHAKLAVADDTLVVGSANLDLRSDRMNYELVAAVSDPELAGAAREAFERDLARSERVLLEAWRRRPLLARVKERLSYWIVARADVLLGRLEVMRTRW